MYQPITSENAPGLALLAQVACGFMRQLVWSPDGAILALSHQSGVWLWEQGFGKTPTRRLETDGAPVKGIAFSPNGEFLVTGHEDGMVWIWAVASGIPVHRLHQHTGEVNRVAFNRDGQQIASVGRDMRVVVAAVNAPEQTTVLDGHTGEITSVAWAGDVLASGGRDKTLRLWDAAARSERVLIPFEDWLRDLAASADGRFLAAACKDGTVALIDMVTAETMRVFEAHEGGADAVAFSLDGALLVTGGRDNLVRVWDVGGDSESPLVTLEGHRKPVLTVAFHPAGSFIASGSGDNSVRLWGVADVT